MCMMVDVKMLILLILLNKLSILIALIHVAKENCENETKLKLLYEF